MLYGRRPNGHFTTRNAIPENGEILRMAEIRSRKFAKYARKRSPAAAQWETQPVGNSAQGSLSPQYFFSSKGFECNSPHSSFVGEIYCQSFNPEKWNADNMP